jgi:hypothetical protein
VRVALRVEGEGAERAREQSASELAALRSELDDSTAALAAATEALEAATLDAERLREEAERGQPETEPSRRPADDRHLLFLPTGAGYELVERPGSAPAPGSSVRLEAELGGAEYLVVKTIRSPLPDADLLCAYLEPL